MLCASYLVLFWSVRARGELVSNECERVRYVHRLGRQFKCMPCLGALFRTPVTGSSICRAYGLSTHFCGAYSLLVIYSFLLQDFCL